MSTNRHAAIRMINLKKTCNNVLKTIYIYNIFYILQYNITDYQLKP